MQRQQIALNAKSSNGSMTNRTDNRMIPEFFSGMNVADVHFNAWNPNIMNGIPDGIAVVRIRTSIDDDCIKHQPCTVQLINNGTLKISHSIPSCSA